VTSDNDSTTGQNGRPDSGADVAAPDAAWDHSTDPRFYEYYAEESTSEVSLERFRRIREAILRVAVADPNKRLEVADVGCGAGSHSMVWAECGHRVHALDINQPLLELGRKRAASAGHDIEFRVGSATALPWADESMDVCVALELLEHVADWQSCLREFTRVVRPGGALFLTTTNVLCPVQAEFNLPLYSWYPAPLKRHYEKLALTTRPDLANFARYPAVTWFTFYGLRRILGERGFQCLDRFDIMDVKSKGAVARLIVSAVRALPPLRLLAQASTPGSIVLAVKGVRS
jgi:2-polyprenyl-6-hydroxyphenyl methylase/3-demethylubiquinone-9 3-methyltransferase